MPPDWERWLPLPGVSDVVGPRPDGTLVALAGGGLVVVGEDGTTSPLGSYATDPGVPGHIAMAPGLEVTGAACRFEPGEIFVLDQASKPFNVFRVGVDGVPSPFVEPPATDALTGIAFDGTGRFGNQLLVAGRRGDRTVVFSIDCRGRLRTLTDDAPRMGGGMAVAPQMFGNHGGDLLGADEITGDVIFVRFDGTSGVLVRPDLPAGAGIGASSVGFLPPGFIGRAGTAYVADRAGAIWRMTEERFSQVGIDENDLMVATQAGGQTRVVRCRATCRVMPLGGATGAGIQGHITVVLGPPLPDDHRAGPLGSAIFAISTGLIFAGGIVLYRVHNKRKVRIGEPATP